MTLISLEDAKAEVRKVVSDFKTRYDINYRLNSLPSIELEDEAEQTEPKETFTATTSPCIVKAEQTENSSEKPNNCEPKICDTCRYYNSNIPCGSTPSACKEADKFAEEFVDGLKKLKPKDEPQTDEEYINSLPWTEVGNGEQTENLFTDKDGDVWEWRGDAWYCISGMKTDCAWK